MSFLRFQFTQNKGHRRYLFKTHPNTLVYCNPLSSFWGVGLAIGEKGSLDPTQWKGQNQLGKLLTKVRDELMADPEMSLPQPLTVNKRSAEEMEGAAKTVEEAYHDDDLAFDPKWSPNWKKEAPVFPAPAPAAAAVEKKKKEEEEEEEAGLPCTQKSARRGPKLSRRA